MKHLFYKTGVLLFIFITGSNLFAGHNTDSLKQLLNNASEADKLEILNQLMDAALYSDLDSACYYGTLLEKKSGQEKDSLYQSMALRGLGICSFYKANYYDAEAYVLKAINLQKANKDTTGLANSYKILTGIYWESERYDQSVDISFKALKLYRETNDTKGIVSSYTNIGLLYKRLDEPQKALTYLKKAANLAQSEGIEYNMGNLYNNTGIVYKKLKDYNQALTFYRKALSEYQKENLVSGVATNYLNIGNIYNYHLDKPDSALYYYQKGLKLSENSNYTIQSDFYTGLAHLFAKKGNRTKSIEYLQKAMTTARLHHDIDLEEAVCFDLYQSYKETGNNKEALSYLERYTNIRDTLTLEKAKVAIANLESKFENEKNQIIIQNMQQKQEADKKIKTLLWLGIALLLLSILLLLFGFKQSKKKSKLKRVLLETEKDKLENDLQFKSRQLTSQALMMMKKNRILNEIYNSLSKLKAITDDEKQKLHQLKIQLKRSIKSEKDWKLFQYYFEEVNPRFFHKLLEVNSKITPSELKLAALVKLNFSIKETAELLNLSPDSVKTTRSVLRKKLGLQTEKNIYDFLNNV